LRWVEISSGSYDIPLPEKVRVVGEFARTHRVMAEIGRKEDALPMTPADYALEAQKLYQAGAAKIIVEGRGSGTGGMYNQEGAADMRIIDAVLEVLPLDDIIFEAPQESQQIFFIREYGPNVNLANIPFEDVLFLETERVGLRFDTIPDDARRRSS
jgi:phosphosulfolactate synthase